MQGAKAAGAAGGLWMWGSNSSGELGDGTTVDRGAPALVFGLSAVKAVASGNTGPRTFTLAAKPDGTVWGWGSDSFILGDFAAHTIPTQLTGFSGVSSVAAGGGFALAVKGDGTVAAWGSANVGQLGDGNAFSQHSAAQPVLDPQDGTGLLTGVKEVAAGSQHCLALKEDGTVRAWGGNAFGTLGDGTTNNAATAIPVAGLTGVKEVAVGGTSSYALKSDGTVWSWGSGAPVGSNGNVPAPLPGATGVVDLSVGADHALALRYDGTVLGWGSTGSGALGPIDGPRPPVFTVAGIDGVSDIAAGNGFSVAVRADGTVSAWGAGTIGGGQPVPTQVPGLSGVQSVTAGGNCVATVRTANAATSWGANTSGQLGQGDTSDHLVPHQVLDLANVAALAAGQSHSVALKSDGTLRGWGLLSGPPVPGNPPVLTTTPATLPLDGVTRISARGDNTLVLRHDGTVWAMGNNGSGQLGNGAAGFFQADFTPVISSSFSPITDAVGIATGNQHALALRADGTVVAWGQNFYGALGDGTNAGKPFAVAVAGLTDITLIACGFRHSVALKADGTVWAWGYNGAGELGDGTTTNRNAPVQVLNLTGIKALATGSEDTLALKSDGTVWSWGENTAGQLGDGTTTNRNIPVQVTGLTGILAIAGGDNHHFALSADGTLWAWGDNSQGQLGDATTIGRLAPAPVGHLEGTTSAACGGLHTLVLRSSAPSISPIEDRVGAVNVPLGPLGFNVIDSVNPGANLTVTAVAEAASFGGNATVTLTHIGTIRTVTVTPPADSSYEGRITLAVSNGETSASTSFSVLFVPSGAPVAAPQSVLTPVNRAVVIAPASTPAGSGPFAVTSLPAHGHLEFNSTPVSAVPYELPQFGELRYVPDTDYTGTDRFEYQVSYHHGPPNSTPAYASGAPAAVSIQVGLIAPTLSSITATPLSSTRARIDWTTDYPADSSAGYSTPGTDYGQVAFGPANVTAHSVTLTGLVPGTLYHFQVRSAISTATPPIETGPEAVSEDQTFTTLAAPTAAPLTVTTPQDAPKDLTLAGTSPDPRPLTFALAAGPQHGTVTGPGAADGVARYTPAAGYVGPDSFTFQVLDADGTPSVPATVSITVTANHAPVADSQSLTVASNIGTSPTSLAITLAATDADGNPLTYVVTNPPNHGTLGTVTGNSVTYTPDLNYTGSDLFRFRASDGSLQSNLATVNITVTNRTPTAFPNNYAGLANQVLHVNGAEGVLANDSDPEQRTLRAGVVTTTTHGTLVLNQNGSFDYTPAADFVGLDTFTYRVTDQAGDVSGTVPVFLVITAEPVAASQSVTLASNTATTPSSVSITFQASDLDGDPLTYIVVSGPGRGTLGPIVNGTALYTPDANFIGTDRIRFTVSDGTHTSNTAIVTITVTNRAPTAQPDSYTARRNTTLRINAAQGLLANDTDPEQKTLKVVPVTAPAHGTLSLNQNGRFDYTPTTGYVGTDSFTYQCFDPQNGVSAVVTVTITVTP